MRPIATGTRHRDQVMPSSRDLASAIGNRGVDVVSSPATIGYLEMVCHRTLEPYFEAGEASVGVGFSLKHLAAAHLGAPVEVESELVSTTGRQFTFKVLARQNGRDIMVGEHVRAVIALERFLQSIPAATQPDDAPADLYDMHKGTAPLLFSVPHAGTKLPDSIAARLTDEARSLPDTDWYVDRLYDFANGLGAGLIRANYSRYVIDLNRPPSDQNLYPGQATTGLCPSTQFDGTPIYRDGTDVDPSKARQRKRTYWQPYHDRLAAELEAIKERHGYAVLYDCHSIASRAPRLFDGTLPDLNLGTAHGATCTPELQRAATEIMRASGFSHAVNGRFVGGYITRHYGRPSEGIHALQMEIGWDAYLQDGQGYKWDAAKATSLKPVLRRIVEALLAWRPH